MSASKPYALNGLFSTFLILLMFALSSILYLSYAQCENSTHAQNDNLTRNNVAEISETLAAVHGIIEEITSNTNCRL